MILSQYGVLLVALMSETAPAATLQGGTAPTVAVIKVQRAASAFSAVLVACINRNDPTRSTGEAVEPNPLLTTAFCKHVLSRAAGRA